MSAALIALCSLLACLTNQGWNQLAVNTLIDWVWDGLSASWLVFKCLDDIRPHVQGNHTNLNTWSLLCLLFLQINTINWLIVCLFSPWSVLCRWNAYKKTDWFSIAWVEPKGISRQILKTVKVVDPSERAGLLLTLLHCMTWDSL